MALGLVPSEATPAGGITRPSEATRGLAPSEMTPAGESPRPSEATRGLAPSEVTPAGDIVGTILTYILSEQIHVSVPSEMTPRLEMPRMSRSTPSGRLQIPSGIVRPDEMTTTTDEVPEVPVQELPV